MGNLRCVLTLSLYFPTTLPRKRIGVEISVTCLIVTSSIYAFSCHFQSGLSSKVKKNMLNIVKDRFATEGSAQSLLPVGVGVGVLFQPSYAN